MMRYAFLINIKGVTPQQYVTVYQNEVCFAAVVGVDGMEAGKDYVKKLLQKGFTHIDLCGEFDARTVEEMQQMGDSIRKRRKAEEDISIRRAEYSYDEIVKRHHLLNQIWRFLDYGVIILLPGVEKAKEVVLRSERCNTRVIFVKDIRQARNAGRRLLSKRVHLIELSRWFDRLRMDSVVEATENAVPIGTCGFLDMAEWRRHKEGGGTEW